MHYAQTWYCQQRYLEHVYAIFNFIIAETIGDNINAVIIEKMATVSYLRKQKKLSVQSTSMISWSNSHDVISVSSRKKNLLSLR